MDAGIVTDKYEIKSADARFDYSLPMENGKGKGLTDLKQGQLIEGKILSVDDKVTIDIKGVSVTADRSLFHDVKAGDVKTFEIVKVSDKSIELAIYNKYDRADTSRKGYQASVESIPNWELVMAQKEQAAKEQMKAAEYKDIAAKLSDIGTRLTEQDYKLLEDEGFSIFELSVNGLHEALDRIKEEESRKELLSDSGKDTANHNPGEAYISSKELPDRSKIEAILKSENIPATKENVFRMLKALGLSHAASALDDKAMKYLISTDAKPTIENIYKACYSGYVKSQPITDEQWNELVNQAAEIISEAGYEVNQITLDTARWLVDNQIPLTKETFAYRKELEGIKANFNQEQVFKNILAGMKAGLDPKDVMLSSSRDYTPEQLLNDIALIQEEAINQAVNDNQELTIGNLIKIQERLNRNPKAAYITESRDIHKHISKNDSRTSDNLKDNYRKSDLASSRTYTDPDVKESEEGITYNRDRRDSYSDIRRYDRNVPDDGNRADTGSNIRDTGRNGAGSSYNRDIREAEINQRDRNIDRDRRDKGNIRESEGGITYNRDRRDSYSDIRGYDRNVPDDDNRADTGSNIRETEIGRSHAESRREFNSNVRDEKASQNNRTDAGSRDFSRDIRAEQRNQSDIESHLRDSGRDTRQIDRNSIDNRHRSDIFDEIRSNDRNINDESKRRDNNSSYRNTGSTDEKKSDSISNERDIYSNIRFVERNPGHIERNTADSHNAAYKNSNKKSHNDGSVRDIDFDIPTETDWPDADVENEAYTERYDIGADIADERRYKEIKALRQLEEIRLKMTLDSAAALQKKGIKVETLELSKVVDELRELENKYYERYFKEADMEASEESINLLRETTNSVEQLKSVPSYVLGSTLKERFKQTIPDLIEEGKRQKAVLDKAGAAYEALMTVPSSEYGDSIKKAFASISSILDELGMENTEQNQRAVRILAYNQMEINIETINQVKAYDMQVNEVINNLHPAVTVRMIKEGLNPLDIPVYELSKKIDNIKQEDGITSEEKYSTFLRKLEKVNGITEAERKAYIGIYRLLYNVEKSDGAAIGAVIKTGREVTLDNLLTAVMTGKKGKVDAVVNDEFGTLEEVKRNKEAISSQLSLFKAEDDNHAEEKINAGKDNTAEDNAYNEQIDYFNSILRHIKDEATPDKFAKIIQDIKSRGQSQNQSDAAASFSSNSNNNFSSGNIEPVHLSESSHEIWDLIKDIPVEKLFEQQKNWQGIEIAEDEPYKEVVSQLRQLCKNAEQSIRFLKDFNMPATPMNLVYAGQILSNDDSPFKKLLKLQQEKNVGKLNINVKEIDSFTDKLVDKQTMEEAYSQLEQSVEDTLEDICAHEQADSITIDRCISLKQQFRFLKKLASREFYQVPVLTDNGITNVNLTIVRKASSHGNLMVSTNSDKLGNIKAELTLKSNEVTGYISCDRREGLEKLKNSINELDKAADETSVAIKKLDYVLIKSNAAAINYREDAEAENEPKNPDTERILYNLAKGLLKVVSQAENSDI